MYRRSIYKVIVDGNDVTSRFASILLNITVTKNSKQAAHTAQITLADADGQIALPTDKSEIKVWLGQMGDGYDLVFEGTVNDVSCRGSESGRQMTISATSADQKSAVKQPALRHKDKAKFKDVAVEWGKKAGLEVTVSGSLADIERDYWIQQNESFQAWGQRLAADLGASFQVMGKRAIFAPRNEGMSATGKPLTEITAEYGVNLLNWDVSPIIGRPQYRKVKGRYFDRKEGVWKDVEVDVKDATAEVDLGLQLPQANETNAKNVSGAGAKESERSKGSGSVLILGDYAAEPEAKCNLVNTRPGIDGTYVIDSVEHTLDDGGFVTKLELSLPANGAGTDART